MIKPVAFVSFNRRQHLFIGAVDISVHVVGESFDVFINVSANSVRSLTPPMLTRLCKVKCNGHSNGNLPKADMKGRDACLTGKCIEPELGGF